NNNNIAAYGGSTQFGWNSPGSDNHPQFFSGLLSHTVDQGNEGVQSLSVNASGTDPTGAALAGCDFTSRGLEESPTPSGGIQNPLLLAVFNYLVSIFDDTRAASPATTYILG